MIRHIVFFSAKDPKDREVIFDGLSLLVDIPHLAHFEIGRNEGLDKISVGGPDFVVYAEFKDAKALAAYKEHPLYEQSISIVRPLRDMRIAADFEVADTARSSSWSSFDGPFWFVLAELGRSARTYGKKWIIIAKFSDGNLINARNIRKC